MGLTLPLQKLDAIIGRMLEASRIPGAAIAVVADGKTVFSRGYGYRDSSAKLPMTAETAYPIASTTKAINTTLLGMLVDEGRLAWDAPAQSYLPWFRLKDPLISTQVTLRDLVTMRTGLPRHDFLWTGHPMSRTNLVERLRYLEPSAGFRERFQYNNLTSTTAGYVASVVSGQSWEELVQQRILDPLGMSSTGFVMPATGSVSLSYHENGRRELIPTRRLKADLTGPSGGSIHSTVLDMTRWITFNLQGGQMDGRALIKPQTLAEIHTPQMVVLPTDLAAPSPGAPYAMGWFVDSYNGHARVSHGGYLFDVSSEVSLFPKDGIGIVSFTNFGCQRLSRLINKYAFDLIMGLKTQLTFEDKLASYEKEVRDTRERNTSVRRVMNTSPSHPLDDYRGSYSHPGYGTIEIRRHDDELVLRRGELDVPLQHWHYDVWAPKDNDEFVIHTQHVFERANRLSFETNPDGAITVLSMVIEPAVGPARFAKQ